MATPPLPQPGSRSMIVLAALFVAGLCGQCSPPETPPPDGLAATLELVSPASPLGLNYGEPATLELGYKLLGQPLAGVSLHVSTDGDDGGATLSTASVVTNDHGEGSVLLTAGAAESAFHVLVTVPQAQDLVIDVAVSRYSFGTLIVQLDATGIAPSAVAVEAGLFIEKGCEDLPPMAKLTGALRSMQKAEHKAALLFPKLLLRDYTVVGRAYDKAGHLVALGCVGMPERLLKSVAQVPLAVPITAVSPSPVGSFNVRSDVQLQLPSQLFSDLSCRYGLGQVLLDALVPAVSPADHDVAMRLQAARTPLDKRGCRSMSMTSDAPDQNLQTLLAATVPAGALGAVATDMAAVQSAAVLKSRLDIRGSESTRWVADHTLLELGLATPTMSKTYSLAEVSTPTARELAVGGSDDLLTLQPHSLSLGLPLLWRRALSDLVLGPRGIMMTVGQLWQGVVSGARSGIATGCDAVEAVLCSKLAPPCRGALVGPCMMASMNVTALLQQTLDDAREPLDLSYQLSLTPADPDDAFGAKTVSGQAMGEVHLNNGIASFSAAVSGTRRAN